MTPSEWDAATDADAMLAAVRGGISDRTLLLFVYGCCRAAEGKVPGAGYVAGMLEDISRRPETLREPQSILAAVFQLVAGHAQPLVPRFIGGPDRSPWALAARVPGLLRHFLALPAQGNPTTEVAVAADQAALLREVVGNPFAEAFDPRWRTETAVALARSIEDEQAWDRLPILADALQDAGCEDARVLGHCRAVGHVHRRGCWVLERILDRP